MVGFSFVSDESPPKSAKYSGLRFQITWVFAVLFADVSEWDSPQYMHELPLSRRQYLCDIVHCPGKTGDVVYEVLMKQWSRYQLFPDSCSAGVGDGGGENEGCSGVHSIMERRQATYIRRRCLLHLPWRVADQGLLEMHDVFEDTKAISTYLHDGSTWARLRAIATQPTAAGGLNLFREGDPAYVHLCSSAPPKHQQDRPATTNALMQWLHSRDHILAQLARKDVATRKLAGKSHMDAVESLNSVARCVRRRLGSVLIHKALFLFHYTEKHQRLSSDTQLSELFQRYGAIMSDLSIDRHVLSHLGVSREDVEGLGLPNPIDDSSWLELVVHLQSNASDGDKAAM
eukprot:1455510-Karenia_brevis.AAC.1